MFFKAPTNGANNSATEETAGDDENSISSDIQKVTDSISSKSSKSIEGVVRKLDTSIYMEGTHYLEAGGVTLALLESTKINLDKYVDDNVEIWGEARRTVEGDGIIIDVSKIEVR